MPVTSTAEVSGLDAALSARAPASHTHSASDISGTAVLTNDARLTDARTPLTHTHAAADIVGTAVVTADARLSDARRPGFAVGDGGTVTQQTSKSTGVTLNKSCGEITMSGAALAAGTIVSFTLTDSAIGANDLLALNHVTTGTRGAYTLNSQCSAGSAVVYVRNNTASSLSEAIVIRFAVLKGVVS